ncbi:Tigger transposable element-derived protein 4 [Gracilariopsis chorda]|uniref:Tigger transposable element-derived protein 4 n=1 Tax=Gracilariopsis chorda TaxID=448386 RepID=A0A2V3IYX1_9FLOR|nr:Tigger transposable element-derived protein 4 [Gracilariopsis chorda]|eukprot:PXF47321.1 Tigger transposable element-derived protein 4 [Gracilariopsis chorda]
MPPRKQISLAKKQEALLLLGGDATGNFSPPKIDTETGKRHSLRTVAKLFKVSPAAVAGWKKNSSAILSMNVSSRRIAKSFRLRMGSFPKLEASLWKYMRECVRYMHQQNLFREDVIRVKALEVRDEMLRQMYRSNQDENRRELQKFKASHGWAWNFMKRNNLTSKRPMGDAVFISPQTLADHWITMKNKLALWPIEHLCNTDEVALLYRCLPSRTVHENNGTSSFVRVKDRMTAVLTVYADGKKAPLTVIGKSMRPRSFPRHVNPARDLGLFYYAQANAWNTQPLWTTIAEGFDKMSLLQGSKLGLILDNCSAHSIDYEALKNVKRYFLPPNTTSALQPVDCAVGRSFKCAYRRLVVSFILSKVRKALAMDAAERPTFKITDFVTAYDALLLMRQAWDMVPKRVILKAWLKTDILSPPQLQDIQRLLGECGNIQEAAMKPQHGRATKTEIVAADARFVAAAERGRQWLEEEEANDPPDVMGDSDAGDDLSAVENIHVATEDTRELQRLPEFSDVDSEALATLYDVEANVDVCRQVSEDDALQVAVEGTLQGDVNEGDGVDEGDASAESNGEEAASNNTASFAAHSYLQTAKNLIAQMEVLASIGHEFAVESSCQDVVRLLALEVGRVETYLRRGRRQTTITSFFDTAPV